jgi:hypothetical protein
MSNKEYNLTCCLLGLGSVLFTTRPPLYSIIFSYSYFPLSRFFCRCLSPFRLSRSRFSFPVLDFILVSASFILASLNLIFLTLLALYKAFLATFPALAFLALASLTLISRVFLTLAFPGLTSLPLNSLINYK